jgi:hypothetical protein
MLEDESPIPALQSDTIKAALKGLIINAMTLATVATGKTFDVTFIQQMIDAGVPTLINVISMYYYWRAWQGRVNATKTIQK